MLQSGGRYRHARAASRCPTEVPPRFQRRLGEVWLRSRDGERHDLDEVLLFAHHVLDALVGVRDLVGSGREDGHTLCGQIVLDGLPVIGVPCLLPRHAAAGAMSGGASLFG